jgi:hypothetical protein
VDGYDIPGGWEKLMRSYYDVMYREDYGWWTLAMAFNAKPGQLETINLYDFRGKEDMGVDITNKGERIIVTVHCAVEDEFFGSGYDYEDNDEDDDEEDEAEAEGEANFETDNELLNLLVQIRQQLIDGDYRALYAVWEVYGIEDEEDEYDEYDEDEDDGEYEDDDEYEDEQPPVPEPRKTGEGIVSKFKGMLGFNE